jgi:hypothetical protein
MKAPLIAVISVGIAAAAPAVAVSAVSADQSAPAPQVGTGAQQTDLQRPIGPVTVNQQTKEEIAHTKLVRRYLRLRKRANRLIAHLHHRKPRVADTAVQVRWSSDGLRKAIRVLRKRVKRLRAQLRTRRAGLTPAVRVLLDRIAFCESKGNPRAIGGGGAFRGKYQFTYGTWRATGGRGDPAAASAAEQDRRAAMLLTRSGSSPWPVCG